MAVDDDVVTGAQRVQDASDTDDGWQSVLASHDRGVREDAARFGDEGTGASEHHHPGRARRRAHQDLTLLQGVRRITRALPDKPGIWSVSSTLSSRSG